MRLRPPCAGSRRDEQPSAAANRGRSRGFEKWSQYTSRRSRRPTASEISNRVGRAAFSGQLAGALYPWRNFRNEHLRHGAPRLGWRLPYPGPRCLLTLAEVAAASRCAALLSLQVQHSRGPRIAWLEFREIRRAQGVRL